MLRLRSVSFQNFKSFREETTIPLGRITCLIGTNGAGKSNILAGLEKMALVLSGGSYEPGRTDYFDNEDSRAMEISATVELSRGERQRLVDASSRLAALPRDRLPFMPSFHLLRYSAKYADGKIEHAKFSMTVKGGSFHLLAEAHRRGPECIVNVWNLGAVCKIGKSIEKPRPINRPQFPTAGELIGYVDPDLSACMLAHFSGMRMLDTDRKLPDTVQASEAKGVSTDGRNLPNELLGAGRDGQAEFDKYMEAVTRGDPESIEPRLHGDRFVLETKEAGLEHRRTHTDLGSGQEQSLILGWQMFNAPGTIIAIKEPELHLHAERQRQMRALIRNADSGLQFIIETHSPVFLGASEAETVLLTTKSGGQTAVARIAPENMAMIREELGISHADALYNANVLFVEGESEFRAFPMFWEKLCLGLSPPPACFSLGGAGGAKRLRIMLEYLKSEGRRFFVVLDNHGDAKAHVRKLQRDGLLGDNVRFLPKSFEDEFTSAQIIDAARKAAAEKGAPAPRLTPEELDAARAEAPVADVVKRQWFEATGSGLDKVSLARHLGSLPKDDIPPDIVGALEAATAYFKAPDDVAPAGGSGSGGGGD